VNRTTTLSCIEVNGSCHLRAKGQRNHKSLAFGFMTEHFCCFLMFCLQVVVCFAGKIGSKALELTYKDKLRMVALTKQVSNGPYREDAVPAVGFFDVVGNDRKYGCLNICSQYDNYHHTEFFLHGINRKLCPGLHL